MKIRNTILNCLAATLLGLGFASEAQAQKLNFNSLLAGSQFLAPATFQLSVYAVPAAGRTFQKVEFLLNGNTSMGLATLSSMANIYTLNVPNQGVGTYTIKARSTDDSGTIKTTGAITVSVREGKAYGTPETITPVPLYTMSGPYGYNEYLPKGYDENDTVKKWPLVISLHGRGGIPGISGTTGQVQIDQLDTAMEGIFETFKMDGLTLPAVVLQPQSGGVSGHEWDEVEGFIVYALSKYNVDPDRVYLSGNSYGANIGALTYASGGTNTNPYARRLAALFPMCGGQFNATKVKGTRMANVPMWLFTSWETMSAVRLVPSMPLTTRRVLIRIMTQQLPPPCYAIFCLVSALWAMRILIMEWRSLPPPRLRQRLTVCQCLNSYLYLATKLTLCGPLATSTTRGIGIQIISGIWAPKLC